MVEVIFILAFLGAVRTSAAEYAQVPLASSLRSDLFQSDTYKFALPIHKISKKKGQGRIASQTHFNFNHSFRCSAGLIAYWEFSQAGYDVHVLERDVLPAELKLAYYTDKSLLVALSQMQTSL